MRTIEAHLAELERRGWSVHRRSERATLPQEILRRYPWMPSEFQELAEALDVCVSPNEEAWLLTQATFSGKGDDAFAWNEWERQSLEAASGDPAWCEEIRAFWDEHLPIFMSVKSGYAYCAIERASGAVVSGREPEYEETALLAESVESFLSMLADDDARLAGLL